MIFLLELKEKIKKVFNRYNTYIIPAVRFVIALVSMILLNVYIGYMPILKNPLAALAVAVVCAFLPIGFMVVVLSLVMVAHLYAISLEFALIALCVVMLMYLLYFRFAPKYGYLIILTVMMCALRLPFVMIVAVGLVAGLAAIIPVSFGVIIFYIIQTASSYEAAISKTTTSDSMQQISYIVETFVSNREWIVTVVAFAATIIVVHCIKRLTIDNAWSYAIIAGTAVQFIVFIAGIIALQAKINMVLMVVGTILGVAAAYVCRVVFFSLDYKRTEYVQYEDDEYYYYVKAVPKINIADSDVQVKRINARNTKRARDINSMNKKASNKNSSASGEDEEDIFI